MNETHRNLVFLINSLRDRNPLSDDFFDCLFEAFGMEPQGELFKSFEQAVILFNDRFLDTYILNDWYLGELQLILKPWIVEANRAHGCLEHRGCHSLGYNSEFLRPTCPLSSQSESLEFLKLVRERYACGASLILPVAIIDLNKLEAMPYECTQTSDMILAAEALSSSLRAFLGKELFGPVGQPTSFFSRFIILSVKWHCDFTLQLKYLNPTDVDR